MNSTVINVDKSGMGLADEALQHTLIGKYFELVLQSGNLPNAICFYAEKVITL